MADAEGSIDTKQPNTILIADDERINLAALNKILSPDYELFIAKSGQGAIDTAKENQPDLILLDVIMPDMNGFDIIVELQKFPETKKIPVIFITGLTSVDDEERGLELGAVDYIHKPFSATIVKARVKTQMKIIQQMRIIEKFSMTDPLTELPNRRMFADRFEAEWQRAIRDKKPISFIMMDVDKFKTYNDTYGHPQGDVLLKSVARIFEAHAQRKTDLAARLGGEEFGVLLPGADVAAASRIAEAIRADVEAMRVPKEDGGITVSTISLGIAHTVPSIGDSKEDFLSVADKRLYRAKESGRNRYVASDD